METTALKQKMRAGKETGSLFNFLMGNNSSVPVVGKGATMLLWTDRHAYEVIEVSEKNRSCKIQRYEVERIDRNGMSESQSYKYEKLTDEVIELYYRHNAWRQKFTEIVFTKEYKEAHADYSCMLSETLTLEQFKEIYGRSIYPKKVVPGITEEKVTYVKRNIIFGKRDEHYDYSF